MSKRALLMLRHHRGPRGRLGHPGRGWGRAEAPAPRVAGRSYGSFLTAPARTADLARRRPSGRFASAPGPSLPPKQQPPSRSAHAQSVPPVPWAQRRLRVLAAAPGRAEGCSAGARGPQHWVHAGPPLPGLKAAHQVGHAGSAGARAPLHNFCLLSSLQACVCTCVMYISHPRWSSRGASCHRELT